MKFRSLSSREIAFAPYDGKLNVIINGIDGIFCQGLLFNGNDVFTYIQMKLQDCSFNIDVKTVLTV